MPSAATRVREHQVVFCGLEVLRLMAERIEDRNDVDGEDFDIVLSFMRDVAHRCLANTEDILRFAELGENVAKHEQAKLLFDELTAIDAPGFVSTCRRYTDLLAHSIFEDRRCLSCLDCDPVTLSQFYEWEREIADAARTHGQVLHHLELKYTRPHCV